MGLLLCLCGPGAARADQPRITVFAAASATNALTDIGRLWEARGGAKMVFSFASSSTLAKQIQQGAPAQVFLSADQRWMDYLEERDLLLPGSRTDLLGNRLALIAPADSRLRVRIAPGLDLAGLLAGDRLAVGDPDHVPAGIYAKEALTKLGLWSQIEAGLARAADVRASLALVERGEAPLGIVYTTDAAISAKVRVVDVFPEESHGPILYPLAILAGAGLEPVRAWVDFLRSPEAGQVFQRHGFTLR